jgi:ATP-dependent HslUV protease subunit HslV
MDAEHSFMLSGTGDVVEPEDEVMAIGSGGPYAMAAARAFVRSGATDPGEVIRNSLQIAGEICVYTNTHITVETLD